LKREGSLGDAAPTHGGALMVPVLKLRETGGTRGLAMVRDLKEAPPPLFASAVINASGDVASYRVTVDDRTRRSPQLIDSID